MHAEVIGATYADRGQSLARGVDAQLAVLADRGAATSIRAPAQVKYLKHIRQEITAHRRLRLVV